ncbi:TetR/AcrR family transcriptional regulator [Yinghuangia sp. YIM S09857]|uniref:TetR/AcrR family transcriptional regulator n=1 Tax=Yinghuangia sp. YIM S09857 TaxID=3436929 RepID=UPI003F52A30F
MDNRTPEPTPPPAGGAAASRPRANDAQAAAAKILDAATELFHERSPASVSLREIARKAGVNYGLIHHYYGTKEAILAEVFRRSSGRGAEVVAGADDLDDALGQLGRNPRAYARMLAWAILDSDTSQVFTDETPAVTRVRELVEEEWARQRAAAEAAEVPGTRAPGMTDVPGASETPHADGFDPRVVAATAVLAVLGWGLFAPFLMPAAGLGDRTEEDIRDEVRALVARMAVAAGTPVS